MGMSARVPSASAESHAAFGLKAHSGWAALVVIAHDDNGYRVADRRRIELVGPQDEWAKQPYHAAETLQPEAARKLVMRGVDIARASALREMRSAIARCAEQRLRIAGCAVLTPAPMPKWNVAEILAVHFRMHKAEGVMFPEALSMAAAECKLRLVAVRESELTAQAERTLKAPLDRLTAEVAQLGKSVGAPWGKDQKDATLAAMVALRGVR
jgi:hypothetical protein